MPWTRPAHVAKAQFAKEALGLDRLTVEQRDVRDVDVRDIGEFDVVLCLGLLYDLDAPERFELMERVASLTRSLALVETQIALNGRRVESFGGHSYRGRDYAEDTRMHGASVRTERSFWMTRPSLFKPAHRRRLLISRRGAGARDPGGCGIPRPPARGRVARRARRAADRG